MRDLGDLANTAILWPFILLRSSPRTSVPIRDVHCTVSTTLVAICPAGNIFDLDVRVILGWLHPK